MPKTVDNIIQVGTSVISLGDVYLSNSNGVTFGASGKTITASVSVAGAEYVLSNSNGISFGTAGSTVTASYTVPTNYVSVAQSSLFQATSDNSLSLGTSYTSHTHSQYLNTSVSTAFLTSQSLQPFAVSATNGSSTFSTLTLGTENGLTLYLTNGSLVGSYTDGGGGGGDGLNRISAGTQIAGITQTVVFSNSNNVSFGMSNNSVITASASYSQPTDYLSTAQSSLFQHTSQMTDYVQSGYTTHSHSEYVNTSVSSLFQATSDNSLSLGTDYTTHTHSQYLNTSQSSLFEQSSHTTIFLTSQSVQAFSASGGSSTFQTLEFANSNGFTFSNTNGSIRASYTVPTDYVSSNQSSLFALTANDSLSLGTAYTTHTHSQYVNTSQSSLFEQTSHTTIFLTTQSGQAYSAGNGSNTFQTLSVADSNGVSFSTGTQGLYATVRTNYASSDHSHGNPTLALTNVSGTTASNSAGFTLSLSVNPAGGADGYNILAAGTQTANTTGTVVLSNSNGISFGMSNSSVITASYTVPTDYVSTAQSSLFLYTSQSSLFQHTSATSAITSNALHSSASRVFNIVAATNNTGGGTASLSSNVSFSNANAVSFYTSAGGAIVASVNTSYAASNHSHGNPTLALTNLSGTTASASNGLTLSLSAAAPGGGGVAIANSQTTYTSGTAHFSGAGAITIQSTTGQSFQISVPATSSLSATGIVSISTNGSTVSIGASQSNQVMTMYATSNTTQSSTGTMNASSMIFAGAGAASVGISNGSIVISAPNAAAGNVTISAGTASAGLASLVFSNSNGVSFGLNGSTITASAVGGGGGIALANSQTTYTSGTAHLSGAGAITVASTTGQSYIISAPGSSSISGTGLVSISVNGSTISIGVPNGETKSFYNPYSDIPMVAGQAGQGTLNINPNDFPNITFDRIYMPINNTNSSNSSGSHTLSFWVGLYTRNGSTLSLVMSASQSYTIVHSGTAGSYSLYSGMRHVSIPLSSSLSEGLYFVGVVSRTTSGGANGSYSQFVASNINSNFLGHFGSSHNTTYQFRPGIGVYSVTTSGIPSSIAISQIRGSDSQGLRPPILIFANSTI